MAEFKKKNKQSFLYSPLVLIGFLIFLIFFIYRITFIVKKERKTFKNKQLLMNEMNSLKQRKIILKKDIAKMQTEEGIEEIIRDRYQVVKKDEKMVTIIDSKKKVELKEEQKIDGFWNYMKNIFK